MKYDEIKIGTRLRLDRLVYKLSNSTYSGAHADRGVNITFRKDGLDYILEWDTLAPTVYENFIDQTTWNEYAFIDIAGTVIDKYDLFGKQIIRVNNVRVYSTHSH